MASPTGFRSAGMVWVGGELVEVNRTMIYHSKKDPLATSRTDFFGQDDIPAFADRLHDTAHPELRIEDMDVELVNYEPGPPERWMCRLNIIYRLWRSTLSTGGSLSYHLRGASSLHQWQLLSDQSDRPLNVNNPDTGDEETTLQLSVLSPQETVERELVIQTDDPSGFKKQWISHVNSLPIWGGAKGQWLVADIQDQLVCAFTTPKYYRFSFTFERSNKNAGWKYEGFWQDANRKIASSPTPTVDNGGKLELVWHEDVLFQSKFA